MAEDAGGSGHVQEEGAVRMGGVISQDDKPTCWYAHMSFC